jgi:hypothetical protein
MKNSLVTNQKQLTTCTNQSIADEFVQRYQKHTQNALENILCMGEAVYEIYRKVKSTELDKSDLQYFCQSVYLDPNGSTFRKYKAIGENASRFRQYLDKLPSTFSVLYELATLDADEFERYVVRTKFSKSITLYELKRLLNVTVKKKNGNFYVPPVLKIPRLTVAKVVKKINRINIVVVRDLPESEFNQVINTITEFRNKGWINFDDPKLTECLNDSVVVDSDEIDDDMKYFQSLADSDASEMRV